MRTAVLLLLASAGLAWAVDGGADFQAHMRDVHAKEQQGKTSAALAMLFELRHHYDYTDGEMSEWDRGDGKFWRQVVDESERLFPRYLQEVTAGQRQSNLRAAQERRMTVTTLPVVTSRVPAHLEDVVSNTLRFSLHSVDSTAQSYVGSSFNFVTVNFIDSAVGKPVYMYSCDVPKLPKAGRFELYSRSEAPVWAPDQRSFAFTFNGCVCVKPLDHRARLLDLVPGDIGACDTDMRWTPDQRGLYFTRIGYEAKTNQTFPPRVRYVDVDGRSRDVADGALLDVSPDARRLLLSRNEDVLLCDTHGTPLKVWHQYKSASFSPDGTLISLYRELESGFTLSLSTGQQLYHDAEFHPSFPPMWMNQGRLIFETPRHTEDYGIVVLTTSGQHSVVSHSKEAELLPWATATRVATTSAVLMLRNQ